MTTLRKFGQLAILAGTLLLPDSSFGSEINNLRSEISQLRKRLSTVSINSKNEQKKLFARQDALEKEIVRLENSLNEQRKFVVRLINYLGDVNKGMRQQSSELLSKSPEADLTANTLNQSQLNNTNSSGPNQHYRRGFDLLVKGSYAQADVTFSNFILTFPNHLKQPNAIYWSGEARYLQKKFEQALIRYQDIIASYPNSNKYSNSLLKASYCLIELKRYKEARENLELIIKKFPNKTVAKLAKGKLELIDLLQLETRIVAPLNTRH